MTGRTAGIMEETVQDVEVKHRKRKGSVWCEVPSQDQANHFHLTEYAIGVFDCDDLKSVNDQYGHDKGDLYLKAASRLICRVFQHSPVFRIGGDEFAVVLTGEDFQNRDQLVQQFNEAKKGAAASSENIWEQVHIALGIAVYDPEADSSVNDTARRADKIMYENKRAGKAAETE